MRLRRPDPLRCQASLALEESVSKSCPGTILKLTLKISICLTFGLNLQLLQYQQAPWLHTTREQYLLGTTCTENQISTEKCHECSCTFMCNIASCPIRVSENFQLKISSWSAQAFTVNLAELRLMIHEHISWTTSM